MMGAKFRLVLVNGITHLETDFQRKQFLELFPEVIVDEFPFFGSPSEEVPKCGLLQRRARDIINYLLHEIPEKGEPQLPIIFVGHDLGGSVIKQILTIINHEQCYQRLALAVAAMVRYLSLAHLPYRSSNDHQTSLGTTNGLPDPTAWEFQVLHLLAISRVLPPISPLELLEGLSGELYSLEIDWSTIPSTVHTLEIMGDSVAGSEKTEAVRSDLKHFRHKSAVKLPYSHEVLSEFRVDSKETEVISLMIRVLAQARLRELPVQAIDFINALALTDTGAHRLEPVLPEPLSVVHWISTDQAFREWMNVPNRILLLTLAPPGLAHAVAIVQLREILDQTSEEAVVISLVLDNPLQAPISVLSSLCRQFLSQRPQLFRRISRFCAEMLDRKRLTEPNLWMLLSSLMRFSLDTPVFCILTCPQPCESQLENFTSRLEGLGRELKPSLRISLIRESSLESQHSSDTVDETMCVPGETTGSSIIEDIVRPAIRRLIRDRPIYGDSQEELSRKLCTMPTTYPLTMTRLGFLRLPNVHETKASVTHRINKLPSSLEEVYSWVLGEMRNEQNAWVMISLRWIVCAARPLTESELAFAVALSQPESTTSVTSLKQIVSCGIIADINRVIGPMVQVLGGRVSLIHESFRSVIAEQLCSTTSHCAILSSCLDYLELILPEVSEMDSLATTALPLLDYSTAHWPQHFKSSQSEEALTRLSKFLSSDQAIARFWKMYRAYQDAITPTENAMETELQIACHFGLLTLVERCIPDVVSSSDSTGILEDALNIAARNGHEELVHLLLSKGAVSDISLSQAVRSGSLCAVNALLHITPRTMNHDDKGYTPLHHCAELGYVDIAFSLLAHGASTQELTFNGSTALHLAAMTGQIVLVQKLLDAQPSVNQTDQDGYDALKLAAQSGFSDIVRALLEKGADANAPAADGNNAFHLAVEAGDAQTIQILATSADINSPNGSHLTPLHLAAERGYVTIVEQLLQRGARLSADKDDDGDDSDDEIDQGEIKMDADAIPSPLSLAAKNGHTEVVKLLLKSDLGRHSEHWNAAIYYAAKGGVPSVLQALLKHGIVRIARDPQGQTALHVAVKGGYLDIVLRLLKCREFDVNDKDNGCQTPLYVAASSGALLMIRALIESGARIDATESRQRTPLHIAASNGHLAALRELRRADDLAAERDEQGATALSLAVQAGHIAIVEEFLRGNESNDIVNRTDLFIDAAQNGHTDVIRLFLKLNWDCNCSNRDSDKQTPLHVASYNGSLSTVQLLLQAEADVNAIDSDGETPLFFAARGHHPNVAKALLDNGADINAEDHYKATPLYRAAYGGRIEIIKELLSRDPLPLLDKQDHRGWTALHAAYDESDIVKLLLDAGADPFLRDSSGDTPISVASNNGYPATCVELLNMMVERTLSGNNTQPEEVVLQAAATGNMETIKRLEHEVNLCVRDKNGTSALHMACLHGNKCVAEFLISIDADVNAISSVYGSPLMTVAQAGHLDIAELLIEKGADINLDGGQYHTAIQAASIYCESDMVELLLRKKADPNQVGGERGTALIAAISNNELCIVQLLLDGNSDPNIRNQENASPLQVAVEKRNKELVQLLLEKGANVNDPLGEKGSALHIAISSGDFKLVQIFLEHQADPKLEATGGDTPIVAAARIDDRRIIEAVVAAGAKDLTVRDSDNRSLLTIAIFWNSHEVIDYLLEQDTVELNEKDNAGRTALLTAVLRRSDHIKHLLVGGADIETVDCEGKTPLIHAIIGDYPPVVELLLQHKASPTRVDARSRSPLYWASLVGSVDTFEAVLQAVLNRDGYRPDDLEADVGAAVAAGRSDFLERLLDDRFVYPNKPGPDGWSPLYIARQYGLLAIEDQLLEAGAKETPVSEAGLLPPSGWHLQDKHPCLVVEDNGKSVSVGNALIDLDNTGQPYGIVRSNYPMQGSRIYYFEVTVERSDSEKIIGVGFCNEKAPLNRMLGWGRESWGYHGDDGCIFHNASFATRFSEPYDANNVIGCGVNFDKNIAFYTKDGKVIGRAFDDVRGKLYPAVCMNTGSAGCKVSANFGDDPGIEFLFKGPFDAPETFEPATE